VGAVDPRRTARLLAGVLVGSGLLHLARPRTYEWLVPPELGPARPWVLGSGVAELVAGALLAGSRTRRAGGRLAAALFVGFVPAHLHTFRVVDRPATRAAAAVRLPLQVPLVRAALKVARAG
jgi:uncharacterized membrane protein